MGIYKIFIHLIVFPLLELLKGVCLDLRWLRVDGAVRPEHVYEGIRGLNYRTLKKMEEIVSFFFLFSSLSNVDTKFGKKFFLFVFSPRLWNGIISIDQ